MRHSTDEVLLTSSRRAKATDSIQLLIARPSILEEQPSTILRFGNRDICAEGLQGALPASPLTPPAKDAISIKFAAPARVMPRVRRWLHRWTDEGETTLSVARHETGYLLRFPRLCDFQLDPDSDSIHVLRRIGLDDRTLEHLLVDQVLPRFLAHQGALIAHASAMTVGSRTLLLLGTSGAGKSTLAALLYRAGHEVLSDDCTVLEIHNDVVTALPTYPSLRLLPDSLEHVFPDGTETAVMADYSDKCRVKMREPNKPALAARVDAIFLLDPTSSPPKPRIQVRRPASACLDLIRHSFQLDVTDRGRSAALLTQCSDVARAVPAFVLSYQREFEQADELVSCLTRHMESLPVR